MDTLILVIQAPEIVSLYALNISPSMIRAKKRADFERHRSVTDLNVIDLLIFKSRQDYQETMNCWKQEPHILAWFKEWEVSVCGDETRK